MLTCGLHALSSRLHEIHAVLLIAATLRNLLEDCSALVAQLFKSVATARKTFVRLFALFPGGGDAAGADARWAAIKAVLRSDLQARPLAFRKR